MDVSQGGDLLARPGEGQGRGSSRRQQERCRMERYGGVNVTVTEEGRE
jgi:hypothetical protein